MEKRIIDNAKDDARRERDKLLIYLLLIGLVIGYAIYRTAVTEKFNIFYIAAAVALVFWGKGVYTWLLMRSYNLLITGHKVCIKNFKKEVVFDLCDIKNYECRRIQNSDMWRFYLFADNARYTINTRHNAAFEEILRDNNIPKTVIPGENNPAGQYIPPANKYKKSSGLKTVSTALFFVALLSPVIALIIIALVGEAKIFGLGMMRYSWIMYLFIAFPVASFVIGLMLKKRGEKWILNCVIAVIIVPLIAIGNIGFKDNIVKFDTEKVAWVENETGLELPNEIKISTETIFEYNKSYVKITEDKSRQIFELDLERNSLWLKELTPEIEGILPFELLVDFLEIDYIVLYNTQSGEFEKAPKGSPSQYIVVGYEKDLGRLIIVDYRK